MNPVLDLIIPGACIPKGRPRTRTIIRENLAGQVQTKKTWGYTPPRSREYEKKARLIAQNATKVAGFSPIPYPQPVRLTVEFVLARQATARPDVINLLSSVADILQHGIAYDDDSQVVELVARKIKGVHPMTHIIVEGL